MNNFIELVKIKNSTIQVDFSISNVKEFNHQCSVCLSRPYHFEFFKGCFPRISLGPFLNTLSNILHKGSLFGKSLGFFNRKSFKFRKDSILINIIKQLWLHHERRGYKTFIQWFTQQETKRKAYLALPLGQSKSRANVKVDAPTENVRVPTLALEFWTWNFDFIILQYLNATPLGIHIEISSSL